jgi:hypothetical protein
MERLYSSSPYIDKSEKMGPGSISYERGHSQLEGITAENGAWPHFFLRSYAGAERNGEGMAFKI